MVRSMQIDKSSAFFVGKTQPFAAKISVSLLTFRWVSLDTLEVTGSDDRVDIKIATPKPWGRTKSQKVGGQHDDDDDVDFEAAVHDPNRLGRRDHCSSPNQDQAAIEDRHMDDVMDECGRL